MQMRLEVGPPLFKPSRTETGADKMKKFGTNALGANANPFVDASGATEPEIVSRLFEMYAELTKKES